MKAIWFSLVVLAIAGLSGCDHKGTSGGPGATAPPDKVHVGQPDDSFSMNLPRTSTKLKQGESRAVSISLDRGKNFDQDVTLKFDKLPQGVSIDPASPEIKHGDKEAKFTIKAADDAAVGDFTVKVMGHPAKGPDASDKFEITVEKK